jgi:hypothetical protein
MAAFQVITEELARVEAFIRRAISLSDDAKARSFQAPFVWR